MGTDFKINEYGEIIRADGATTNTDKKPQKSNKRFLYFFIFLILVVLGLLLNNYLNSYMLNKNLNSLNNPPTRIQSSPEVFLNGNIGSSLTVKMYLRHEGNNCYSGWYYYLKNGPNNKLTLQGTAKNDILRLDEYNTNGERTGTFEGVFNGSSYSGTLYVYHSNKTFNFTLYDL